MPHIGDLGRARRLRLVVLRALLDVVLGLIVRRQIIGLERIPPQGPCLLVFNHLSNFDPVLIFVLMRRVGRTDATGLVAASYRRGLVHRLAIGWGGGTWLRRGERDRAAMRLALGLLQHGWLVGIAPEGGRSPTGGLRRAHTGAAFLAARTSAPVVPLGLTGTLGIAGSLRRFRRPTVTINVGEPFTLPPLAGENHRGQLRASTDHIMGRIAALLPPEYRGDYPEPSSPQAHLEAAGP